MTNIQSAGGSDGPANKSFRALHSVTDSDSPVADNGARVLGFNLIQSAEPAVVFASMAATCVPAVCDRCVIDILEAGLEGYRIAFPRDNDIRGSTIIPSNSTRRVVVHFDNDTELSSEDRRYEATAEFSWQTHTPGPRDTAVIDLLVGRAIGIVAWQRSEQRTQVANSYAENLKVALTTSRQIGTALGILMGIHKINDEQAFLLLRSASQRTHRKLRDVADDVIHTGWLDPVAWSPPNRA